MKPIRPRKRTLYFLIFSAIFILAIPFLIFYSLGYTITNDYTLDERGGIYVFVPEYGSEIFVDNELKKTTGTFQKELFLQNLKPQSYLVLVSNERFWPWAKKVSVTEKEVSPLYPFLVPKDVGLQEIKIATSSLATSTLAVSGAEYKTLNLLFEEKVSNSIIAISTSTDANAIVKKKMKIWSDDKKIFAQWVGSDTRIPPYFCSVSECDPLLTIFDSSSVVRHIDFYPGRDDAIIMSVGDGVFAIEIDTRDFHNFYPLYHGKKPDFRINNGRVYIKDTGFLGQLTEL